MKRLSSDPETAEEQPILSQSEAAHRRSFILLTKFLDRPPIANGSKKSYPWRLKTRTLAVNTYTGFPS
jgi:hypothetical protein